MSRAGKLFKAYCWAEALFVGYLLLKPREPGDELSKITEALNPEPKTQDPKPHATQDP